MHDGLVIIWCVEISDEVVLILVEIVLFPWVKTLILLCFKVWLYFLVIELSNVIGLPILLADIGI